MRARVGYGGGAIGDYPWNLDGMRPWSSEDSSSAIELIKSLPRLGVDFIDTANRYGFGESERVIGRAVEGMNFHFDIVTKIELSSYSKMIEDYNISRRRLGKIDGLLFHNPDLSNTLLLNQGCGWLKSLKNLKWRGFSTEPTPDAKVYYDSYGLNAIEFPYSFYDRRAESDIFPWATGIFKIANRCLGGPNQEGKTEESLKKSLDFIMTRIDTVDVFLIGTTKKNNLIQCLNHLEVLSESRRV